MNMHGVGKSVVFFPDKDGSMAGFRSKVSGYHVESHARIIYNLVQFNPIVIFRYNEVIYISRIQSKREAILDEYIYFLFSPNHGIVPRILINMQCLGLPALSVTDSDFSMAYLIAPVLSNVYFDMSFLYFMER